MVQAVLQAWCHRVHFRPAYTVLPIPCLCWAIHDSSLCTQVFSFREKDPALFFGLNRFFNSPEFSDLTILSPDGSKVFVHQIVLASCSKRFSDVLEQGEAVPSKTPQQNP